MKAKGAYRFFKLILRLPFRLIYRIKIIGADNEPDGPFIVSANHMSYADPFIEGVCLKTQITYIAKSSLERFRIIKWFFSTVGVIPIKREESDVAAIRKSVAALKGGKVIGIYPQGTRIPLKPPHKEDAMGGLGLLVSLAKCPVLPMAIVTRAHRPRPFRKTLVVIGKPLSYETVTEENGVHRSKQEMAEFCFSETVSLYEEAYSLL